MEIAERSPLLKQKGRGGYRAPFFCSIKSNLQWQALAPLRLPRAETSQLPRAESD